MEPAWAGKEYADFKKGAFSSSEEEPAKSELEGDFDILRLANALSALYSRESEEKKLLDAMLLAVPR